MNNKVFEGDYDKALKAWNNFQKSKSEGIIDWSYFYVKDVVEYNIGKYIEKEYNLEDKEYVRSVALALGSLLEDSYKPLIDAKNYDKEESERHPLERTPNKFIHIEFCNKYIWEQSIGSYKTSEPYYVDMKDRSLEDHNLMGVFDFDKDCFINPEKYFDKDLASQIKAIMSLIYEFPYEDAWEKTTKKCLVEEYDPNYKMNVNKVDGFKFAEDPSIKKWFYKPEN